MRLLSLSLEEITALDKKMEKEIRAIKEELMRLCWFMRGSLSVEEAHNLDNLDREIISKLIEENLEHTKKSGLPFF